MKKKATKKKTPMEKAAKKILELRGYRQVMCKDCNYSMPMTSDDGQMYCHRNPLMVKVGVSHWCGEFKTE